MKRNILLLFATVFVAGLVAAPLSADPVVKYLEGKGVLTTAEAEALRLEIAEERKPAGSQFNLRNSQSVRIDGRIYVGYLDREDRERTFHIPDGALRFTWAVADDVEVVTRFRFNNAGGIDNLDNMYVRFKKILPFDPTSHLSVGKFKMDVGEEHKSDNRIGNWPGLISNSAAALAATDWGAALSGSFQPGVAGYALSVSNANNNRNNNTSSMAWSAKAHAKPADILYLSASYMATGSMEDDQAGLRFAGNRRTFPGAAVDDWKRSAWKVVARLTPTGATRLGAAWGQFTDAALAPTGVDDIKGDMYYLEARQDLAPEFYLAARYSSVRLKDNATATLNGLDDCTSYDRLSIGAGYRLAKNVTIKAEYTWNDGKAAGEPTQSDNWFAMGAAVTF